MTLTAPMRCSALAEELDEPMIGSVDQRVRWLLVEDRSAWGEKAVREVLGPAIESAAKARGMRLLLVRRREGDPAADVVRRVFLVDTAAGRMAVRTIEAIGELEPLLDAELDQFGPPLSDPILLVCTNGKRDACCALRGRALMASLAPDHAERTWECTHLGGHRFAANLVCLPDGIVYGRVGPGDGPRLADAYLAGRVDADLLRGRSAWPPPAQAAEQAIRRLAGIDALDALALTRVDVDGERATVTLESPHGDRHEVRLRRVLARPPRPISCRADELESPVHWLVDEAALAPSR